MGRVDQIRDALQIKSTDELKQMLAERDLSEWTPEAFEAASTILEQRQSQQQVAGNRDDAKEESQDSSAGHRVEGRIIMIENGLTENRASWTRVPLYLWISATSVFLAIAVVYVTRTWFFNNSLFAGSPPDPTTAWHPAYYLLFLIGFFFLLLLYIAPACVSYIALRAAAFLCDAGDLKVGGAVFQLFTVLLVLVGLWLLAPHIDLFTDTPQYLRMPVAAFRWVYLCANGLVGLIVIAIEMKDAIQLEWSIRKRMGKR